MQLQLTNKCSMECPHCMENSIKEINQYMSLETAQKALEFIDLINPLLVLITGGEFTEHPDFFEICSLFKKYEHRILLCSNGSFIEDSIKYDKIKYMLNNYNFNLKICSIEGLYTNYESIQKHKKELQSLPNCHVEDYYRINSLVPLGRAKKILKENPYKYNNFFITCKIFYDACKIMSFKEACNNTEQNGFGPPFIDWKGNIHIGETLECTIIGNIFSFKDINNNIIIPPCEKCNLFLNKIRNTNINYNDISSYI